MSPHIVITGLMGVGKSTTAAAVAERLGRPHRDSDEDIESLFGMTGAQLAATRSVDDLHQIESAVLLGALATTEPTVISAAGWVVVDPMCVEAMGHRSTVIVLDASVGEILRRAATGDHRRPIDRHELIEMVQQREQLFARVADLRCEATDAPDDLATAIVDFVER